MNQLAQSVSRKNIIQKVCLVRFGSALKKDRLMLRQELQAFLRTFPEQIVARQAVNGWFLNKHPARAKAYEFLLRYLKDSILKKHLALGKERQDLHDQIKIYARNKWEFDTDLSQLYTDERRAHFTERNNIGIRVGPQNNTRMRSSPHLEGNYFVYHSRLTQDSLGHFTQEVMRIDRDGRFKLWYYRDGTHIEQYNGVIFLFGNVIWFLGSTNSAPDRLRLMAFKLVESIETRYSAVRWGLMLGDMPSSHEPMSCRVVLYRITDAIENMHKFAENNVRNFESRQLKAGRGKAISRLMKNSETAESAQGSETAASLASVTDHFLKVNEDTIKRICDYIEKLDYSAQLID
jgi:hypothetical protein